MARAYLHVPFRAFPLYTEFGDVYQLEKQHILFFGLPIHLL